MESEAAELGGLNGWSGSVLCCFWEVVAVALERQGGLRTAAGIFILLLRQQGTKKREKIYKTSSN